MQVTLTQRSMGPEELAGLAGPLLLRIDGLCASVAVLTAMPPKRLAPYALPGTSNQSMTFRPCSLAREATGRS